jgi:alpha-tubulin suppressor-like RCC1 family protein
LIDFITTGWNFIENNHQVYDPHNPSDSNHGTHITGQIAASLRDYQATTKIMPLKVFTNGVAHTSDVIRAIQYAEEMGVSFVNCSFGTTSENPALEEAIANSNMVFICAAGNSRNDLAATPTYPAAYRFNNVISVGSINSDGGYSYFSNFGPQHVDIAALGREVNSTLPENQYGNLTGTSVAAAKVTGIAAVLISPKEEDLSELLDPNENSPKISSDSIESDEQAPYIDEETQTEETSVDEEQVNETQALEDSQAQEKVAIEEKESVSISVENQAIILRNRILESADRLSNLTQKVDQGRAANMENAVAGLPGENVTLHPQEDFDVHGYVSNPSETFQLYSAAGRVIQAVAGYDHTIVLKENGTVWAYGRNDYGQCGNGNREKYTELTQVIGLTGIKKISTTAVHVLALKQDGTVWGFGDNLSGKIGDGTTTNRAIPVQISSLNNIKEIAAGGTHSLAVKEDGSLFTWGANTDGQLGDGTTINRQTPQQLTTITNVKTISAGNNYSLAIIQNNSAWAWGNNMFGQLGIVNTVNQNTPQAIYNMSGVKDIAAGFFHSLVIKSDDTLWSFGFNGYGQLGNNSLTNRVAPAEVHNITTVKAIAAGQHFSLALKTDGTVMSFGVNSVGQLGDNTTTNRSIPVQVNSLTGVTALSAGNDHGLAIKQDGKLWAWGGNHLMQLGCGDTQQRSHPVPLDNLHNLIAIAGSDNHQLALKTDGTVVAWGMNLYGQLGDNTRVDKSTPVPVQNLNNIIAIAAGENHSIALKGDGSVWVWGDNSSGQLGNSSSGGYITTPMQVSNLTNIKAIATKHRHNLALKTDGSLWGWGANNAGQLGIGTTTNSNVPVQISSITAVTAISAGTNHSLAVKQDGSTWAWGNNNDGQLGDKSYTNRNTPVKVSNLTNVTDVAAGANHSLAITQNGEIWSWGNNYYGQLGYSGSNFVNEPTKINTLSGITGITSGNNHNLALKQDGSVFTWGNNEFGQLADGTKIDRTIPNQVISLKNISTVSAGHNHSVALKEGSTNWAWGCNQYNKLLKPYLLMSLVPIESQTEPKDHPSDIGTAQEYTITSQPTAITGNISHKNDTDAFKFSFTEGNYTIRIESPNPNLVATLYDSSQNIVNPGFVNVSPDIWEIYLTITEPTIYFLILGYNQNGVYSDCPYIITIIEDANFLTHDVELNCVTGAIYPIALIGTDLAGSLNTTTFVINYDPQKLTPLYVHNNQTLGIGPVPGTNMVITTLTAGEIKGNLNKSLLTDHKWQGTMAMFSFKAIANGMTVISSTCE